jgi:hypothetical protein
MFLVITSPSFDGYRIGNGKSNELVRSFGGERGDLQNLMYCGRG